VTLPEQAHASAAASAQSSSVPAAGIASMKRDDNVDERDPLTTDPNCQYVKVKSLSAGAFGFVQHARIKATGRDVAIKFMQRGSEGMKKYVEYELLNHRTLRHPHVIQFKEVFLTPEYICIVMEYASGGSLFNHVQKAGALREPTARWFFQQLMVGLDYCHRKGVVNRDIKLENTLLKNVPNLPLPLVKICDFGYSKDHLTSDPKSKVGDG
jgi:serine/threonine-protein kinase SRK2